MSRRSIDELLAVSSEQWEDVLSEVRYRKAFAGTFRNTLYTLIAVAAAGLTLFTCVIRE